MDVNTICAGVIQVAVPWLFVLFTLRVYQRAHYRWCPKCKGKLRMLSIDDMTAILTEHTEADRDTAKMATCIYGMARGPVFACAKCKAWWSSEATR